MFLCRFFYPAMKWRSGRKTRSWNVLHETENRCHKICASGLLSWNHTIPITLSPWPSSSLHLPVHYFLISAPLPLHHLFSPPLRATVPLPACLCWYSPPLSASVNAFCPYKERAQADCTNRVSSAGVLLGQGDHSDCNSGVRWEEDGGECLEEGWLGVLSYHTSINDSK